MPSQAASAAAPPPASTFASARIDLYKGQSAERAGRHGETQHSNRRYPSDASGSQADRHFKQQVHAPQHQHPDGRAGKARKHHSSSSATTSEPSLLARLGAGPPAAGPSSTATTSPSFPRRGRGPRQYNKNRIGSKDLRQPTPTVVFDAAQGADLILGPVGKAWHPNSQGRKGKKGQPTEDGTARHDNLLRLRSTFESEFHNNWASNERILHDNGCRDEWAEALQHGNTAALRSLKARAVGSQIQHIWESKRGAHHEERRRVQVCNRVQRLLAAKWPGSGLLVVPFGSTATGMASDGSDLDLCLLDPQRGLYPASTPAEVCRAMLAEHADDLPPYYKVRNISRVLEYSHDFLQLVPIVGAKVPIVKYVDRATQISGDINVNNRFGVVNSTMISAYCDIRPELVRPLIVFVKQCFKLWGFNDPSGSKGPASFSSYTIALLVIYYLQRAAILPNLQDVSLLKAYGVEPYFLFHAGSKRESRTAPISIIPAVTAYDTTFLEWRQPGVRRADALSRLFKEYARCTGIRLVEEPQTRTQHEERLGESALGFFRSFLEQDWKRSFVCAARGASMSRNVKLPFAQGGQEEVDRLTAWYGQFPHDDDHTPFVETMHPSFVRPALWDAHPIVVQDPFICTRNTAGNVGDKVAQSIWDRVRRVVDLLDKGVADEEVRALRAKMRIDSRRAGAGAGGEASAELLLPNLAEVLRVPRYLECVDALQHESDRLSGAPADAPQQQQHDS